MMKDEHYDSIRNKLKKLQALAEEGYGGEAENARRILERLCNQYGVSLEEVIDEDKPKEYMINIGRRKLDLDLFTQCYSKVTGNHTLKYMRMTRNSVRLELTPYQAAELQNLYIWHKTNFERDLEKVRQTIFEAYIHKHRLFSDKPHEDGCKDSEEQNITPEEFKHIKEILAAMETLNDNTYQKMIE